jgi:hypothetical protein
MSRSLGYSATICFCLFAISGAPASVRADTITIHMKPPMAYDPPAQNVKAGDTVEWVDDGGRHSATPDSNQPDPFQASPVLSPEQTYSVIISVGASAPQISLPDPRRRYGRNPGCCGSLTQRLALAGATCLVRLVCWAVVISTDLLGRWVTLAWQSGVSRCNMRRRIFRGDTRVCARTGEPPCLFCYQ